MISFAESIKMNKLTVSTFCDQFQCGAEQAVLEATGVSKETLYLPLRDLTEYQFGISNTLTMKGANDLRIADGGRRMSYALLRDPKGSVVA